MKKFEIYTRKTYNMGKKLGEGQVMLNPAMILGVGNGYVQWTTWDKGKQDWWPFVHGVDKIDFERDWKLGGELTSEQARKMFPFILGVDLHGSRWMDIHSKWVG